MSKTLRCKKREANFSDIVDRAGRLSERVVVTEQWTAGAVVWGR